MKAALRVGMLGAAILAIAACSAATEVDVDEEVVTDAITSTRELAIDEDPSVLVEHPDTLRSLEGLGFDLGSRLTGARLADNRAFAASGEGASIVAAVEADVAQAKVEDSTVGVGMRFGHRAFDASWLRSKEVSFELVAVANRLDRRHATPQQCGEIHLVYRLAYANTQASSRLPMTLMLVYPQGGPSCASVATKWLGTRNAASPAETAAALSSGPLAGLPQAPKVEMNFQLVRWPSTMRQDMGGHAEYSLRVFERSGRSLVPVRLENTPREDLSAAEQSALATWVKDNVKGIDDGTAKVPSTFLAEKTISVSPKGLARGQNRPFATYFGKDGAGVADVQLAGLSLVESKTALLRRLDTMTCNGCHQSQSLAGFQILGTDRKGVSDANALVEGISPHTREQVAFRKADLEAVSRGRAQLAPIPFAEHGSVDGEYGSVCGLGDAGFAKWTCADNMECSDLNGDDVGICVSKGTRQVGQACEEATVSFSSDPKKDRVKMDKVLSCTVPGNRAGRCVRSGGDPGGFPTGMCSGSCTTMGKVEGDGICGLSVPTGFNDCIGRGRPFEECVAGGSKQYRRACSAKTPCGPDYVCSAVPNAPAGVGACLPPYFIFQARVDGHIVGN